MEPADPTELSLRPLRRSDLSLVERWMALPHVERWWHQALGRDALERHYGPRIDGTEPTHVYAIELGGRLIGLIQWYGWRDYPEHSALLGADATAAGLDLLIGDSELVGRGLGSRAVERLIASIVDPAIASWVVDPADANARSLRMFERLGFRAIGRYVDESGIARRIMRRER